MKKINDIKKELIEKLKNEDFVIDKTDSKTVELVGESYIADEEVIFGTLNMDYAIREVIWYESQSLNVYDLPKTPLIWKQVSDSRGYINSNYGYVIYSEENGNQYKHCLRTLRKDKDSRRAMMIYTRPSMQWEFNKNGMSDFMCTNSVQILIRDNKLDYILNQRSCDAVFGAKNDLYWARHVQNKLVEELVFDYPEHVYSRHFHLIDENYRES